MKKIKKKSGIVSVPPTILMQGHENNLPGHFKKQRDKKKRPGGSRKPETE